MSNLFAVDESAVWYTFKEYEVFQDSEGHERIRPQNGSRRIKYNPFEFLESERAAGEPGVNLLLAFEAIGQNIDNKEKTKKNTIEFVKHYGLLGFYGYGMIYRFVDTEKVYTKQRGNCLKLPSVMDFADYRSLFFDKEFLSSEIGSWPENTWLWYHYSERIDWIIEKARSIWKHLQYVNELKQAIKSGLYVNEELYDSVKKERVYYADFLDLEFPAKRFTATNVSFGLEYNDEKQELEIVWGMNSLMSFIEIIHIKKCTSKKSIAICKECETPYLITSPLKNSGCCGEICRHRFNARKSKSFKDLDKKSVTMTKAEYEQKHNELINKYGQLTTEEQAEYSNH